MRCNSFPESRDLTCAISYETTTFLPIKGNLIQVVGMLLLSWVVDSLCLLSVKVFINFVTVQRGKPFQEANCLIFWISRFSRSGALQIFWAR
jgi:hypothetical protein